jgi:hypothetical protein
LLGGYPIDNRSMLSGALNFFYTRRRFEQHFHGTLFLSLRCEGNKRARSDVGDEQGLIQGIFSNDRLYVHDFLSYSMILSNSYVKGLMPKLPAETLESLVQRFEAATGVKETK